MKKLFLLIVIVLLSVGLASAQTTYTWIGATGGSWAVSTNWSPTRTTPALTDIVQFNDGATYTVTAVPTQTIRQLLVSNNSNITLQAAASGNVLSINGAASTANLSVASGSTLTLGSSVAFTLNFVTTLNQQGSIAGTLNVNASNTFTTTALTTAPGVTVTGTLQNNGGTINGNATSLNFASGGTYIHAMNGGAIPTATWNAASNCNITGVTTTNPTGLSGIFGNFTWNNAGQTSATGAISAAMTVNGSLNIAAGTLLLPTFGITGNATGTFTMASGTTLQVGNGATAVTWPSGFTTANTTLNAASTVIYGCTVAQTVSGVPAYRNLTITGASVKTLGAATTVNGNLSIATGATLADGAFQLTGNSTGTFTIAGTGALQIGAATATITAFPTNFLTSNISLASTSTVTYTTITNAQTVAGSVAGVGPGTYGNLVITGTTGTKTLSGNTTVAGNLTINTTATLADGGNTLSVRGNVTNSGTHSSTGSGRILITNGTAAHSITSAVNCTFGNIEISDATWATTITNTGALNPTNTTLGSLTVSIGTFNIGAMVTSGTGGLTVSGTTTVGNGTNTAVLAYSATGGTRAFGNIIINNAGTFNITTGPASSNVADITVNTGGTWNNNGNLGWAVSGSVTNSGAFTSGSATYTLSGAARSINGTIQFTAISMSGTYTNNGTMTVTNTFNGGGTLTQGANATLNTSVAPIPTLNCTANTPNLVRYFGATGLTIKSTTYSNLQIDMNTAAISASVSTTAITVNGNLNVSGGIFSDGGLQTVGNATGTLTVANGATIQYGVGGATTSNFPTNFTTANTTLGATSTTIYNTTSAVTISAVPATYGNLTLSGTGTKTAGSAEIIQGNLTHNAGTFANGGFVITVNGNITNAAIINGTGRILLTGGTANHTLAGIGSYVNLELDDALGATFTGASPSISGVLTQTAGTLSLSAGTTLAFSGSLAATGTGDFGGTTTSGLNITGTGPLGNTLRFNAAAQNLSVLTINRTSGVINLGSDINLNAASSNGISITTGLLYLGNFNATLNTTTTMSLGSASAMVVADAALGTGELRKIFPSGVATSFTFAVGDATGTLEYTQVNLNSFTATGGTKTIGIKVTDAIHPQMNSNGTQTNYISRFYTFSESGPATSYTYATNSYIQYINSASDVVGGISTATAQLNRYDNSTSTWFQLSSTITAGQASTSALLNNVTGTLGGNDFTIRLNPAQTYTWVATSGSGDWNTATNWTPSRVVPSNNDVLQFINGGNPTATNVPIQTIGTLLINGNTDVTLTSAAATQTLTIAGLSGTTFTVDAGSALRLSSTGANSTVIAFSGTNITNIAGTIELNTNNGLNNTLNFTNLLAANNIITGTITNNGGIVTSTAAQTTFGAGSTYNHARNGGAIPLATWNTTSNCNITGITNTALTAFNGAFGNLTWNCPSQTVASPLLVASSVAGNLTVTAGTLSDGSTQITGNATGTLSVANGATLQIGTAAGATTFPTLFTTGNISLATGSTVIYGSSGAQNVAGLTYHNLTLTSSGAKTFVAAPTINGNLAITGCTVNDNGFQITGNATGTLTMSNSASSILVLGTAATATAFPTNFVAGNITLSSPSIVRYNSNLNQTVSNVPTYSVLQLQSAAGTPTKTLAGNTLVTGSATPMVNIGTGNTFNLGGFNLTLQNSGGTSPISNTGTISANTDGGSTIILTGTAHNFAPGTILTSARPNLTISVNAAATVTIAQATPQVALSNLTIGASNTLSLSAGAQLGIAGTYTNNGTLTANTSGTTITLNGNSPQTFTVGTYTGSSIGSGNLASSGGLAINNTAGVTLGSPLTVAVLTLTNGILNCNSTNFVTVGGTGAACTNLGNGSSFVNGPLVRSLPAGLVAGSTYSFPVGKSAYNLFELISPTTTLATTIRAEVFDAAAGGTDGIAFSSLPNPDKHWQVTVLTGALTASGTIRLGDAVNVPTPSSVIGNSATVAGTYNPIGGTNAGNFFRLHRQPLLV